MLNHLDEFLLAGKTPAIISFSLQNTPKSLHGAVINAVGHTGHTLNHSSLLKLMVKRSAGVLVSSVTVEQRMDVRISFHCLVKSLINEGIIVSFAYHIGDNAPVAEVKDGTQVELMHLITFIPFELRHISKPFLIGFARIELAVQQILRNIPGVLGASGAAMVIVFHGRPDISDPANPQHPLVVDMNAVVVTQIIIKSPVAFIRAFLMDFFNPVSQTFILCGSTAQFSGYPFMVGRAGYME